MAATFESEFNKFCSDQDVMVGTPSVIFYGGEHSVLHGGVAITQQIPCRLWVGLKRDDDVRSPRQPIRIPTGEGYHRVWLSDFGGHDFQDFKPVKGSTEWTIRTQAIEKVVNRILTMPMVNEFFNLDGMPLTVSILTNIRSGSGCNFSGSFSSALFTAIRLMAEQCGTVSDRVFTNKYITENENGSKQITWGGNYMPLLGDPHSALHKLNRAALVLEAYFHNGKASGYGTITPLIPTKWPMLYFREGPSDDRIPSDLKINNWEELTDHDLEYLQEKLVDPEKGLQYRLVPLEKCPAWPKKTPTKYPFSFGLLFSGNPKNTAQTIEKVRNFAKEMSENLAKKCSFFQDKSCFDWPEDIERPLGLQSFADLVKGQDFALKSIYSATIPATWGVASTLLQCFHLHDANRTDQMLALQNLAEAIWGAQGGLDQLRLVDNRARWLAGRLVEHLKGGNAPFSLKYIGGSSGGYLLYVGDPEIDLHKYVDEVRKSNFVTGDKEWEKPSCDYMSSLVEPDDKGMLVEMPMVSGKPQRWPMICYHPCKKGWIKDEKESRTLLPEWRWKQIRQEYRNKYHWCLIELDFREGKNVQGTIYLRGLELSKFRNRDLGGRGEAPLAHAIFTALESGGCCSKSDIISHIDSLGSGGDRYFQSPEQVNKFILKELKILTVWNEIFDEFIFSQRKKPDDYTLTIPPKSDNCRIYIYQKHQIQE